jgi:hypothetical protein
MHTMNKTSLAALMGWLSLGACSAQPMSTGTPSDEADPSETSLPQPLCPACRGQIGGQTSDFGGITQECDWQSLELTAESIEHYEVDAVRALLEAGVELPLFWSEVEIDDDLAAPRADEAASESMIEATFTIETFERFDEPSCGEKVSAAVTMVLSTQDGRLQAELHGQLSRTPYQPVWQMFLTADLAEVTGTLDLPIDDTRIHDGRLIAQLYADDARVSGLVLGRVSYYESEADYELRRAPSDTPSGETANMFYAWFPDAMSLSE